jgi:hypothetical protein
MGLDAWCAYFQKKGVAIDRKLDHEPSGRVTQEELFYCSHDVKITQQLLNAGKNEFDVHPLSSLLPDHSFSPAAISKAYMREMGITRPLEKFKISPEIHGIAMGTYQGGVAHLSGVGKGGDRRNHAARLLILSGSRWLLPPPRPQGRRCSGNLLFSENQ